DLPELSRDLLVELYVDQGLSCRAIAARVGGSDQRVLDALHRQAIPVRPRGQSAPPPAVSARKLRALYVDERRSEAEIAALYDTNAWQVRQRLQALGIRRPVSPPHPPPLPRPPREVLEDLYVTQGLDSETIARRFRTSAPVVRAWLRQTGIPVAPRTTRATRTDLPATRLEELYVGQGMTITEVADTLDVSHHVVRRALHDHGIPVRRGGTPSSQHQAATQLLAELYGDPDVTALLARHGIPAHPQPDPRPVPPGRPTHRDVPPRRLHGRRPIVAPHRAAHRPALRADPRRPPRRGHPGADQRWPVALAATPARRTAPPTTCRPAGHQTRSRPLDGNPEGPPGHSGKVRLIWGRHRLRANQTLGTASRHAVLEGADGDSVGHESSTGLQCFTVPERIVAFPLASSHPLDAVVEPSDPSHPLLIGQTTGPGGRVAGRQPAAGLQRGTHRRLLIGRDGAQATVDAAEFPPQLRTGGHLGELAGQFHVRVPVVKHVLGPAGSDTGGKFLDGRGGDQRDAVGHVQVIGVDDVAGGDVEPVLLAAPGGRHIDPRGRAGLVQHRQRPPEGAALHPIVGQGVAVFDMSIDVVTRQADAMGAATVSDELDDDVTPMLVDPDDFAAGPV